MPLTDYQLTRTTLCVETDELDGKYEPIDINYGTIYVFHGTLRRHYASNNSSPWTRVSIDFRIGFDACFDPAWVSKEVKATHGRRTYVL